MKKRSSAEMQKIIQSHSGEAKQTALRFTRDEAAAEKITREALLYSSKYLTSSEKKFYKKFMRRTGKLCGEYIKNTSFAEKDGSSSNLSEAAIAGACRGLYFTERRKKFLFAACAVLLAAATAAFALCIAFIPRQLAETAAEEKNLVSEDNYLPPYEPAEFSLCKLGETFYEKHADRRTYITFTELTAQKSITVDGKALEGYFLVADIVVNSDCFAVKNNLYSPSCAVVYYEQDDTRMISLSFNQQLCTALSFTDPHADGAEDETRGMIRLVFDMQADEYSHLYEKSSESGGAFLGYRGDVYIRLPYSGNSGQIFFTALAREITF